MIDLPYFLVIRIAIFVMVDEGFDQLNEGQKQCLRLVLGHMNSKEIGRELDISPHTVDQRLRGAMRALGASSRFEAARKFAAHDDGSAYQSLIYQSSDIENSPAAVSLKASGKDKEVDDSLIGNRSTVDGGSAALTFKRSKKGSSRLPIPRYRGEKNELTTVERLGWVLAIAIGSAVSFGGILAGLEALSRLSG